MNKTAASRMTTILAWSLCAVSVAVAGAALGLHILSGGVDPKGVTDGWASRVLTMCFVLIVPTTQILKSGWEIGALVTEREMSAAFPAKIMICS